MLTGGESQRSVNTLICQVGHSQVVDIPTRGESILDVFLIRPRDLVKGMEVFEGISDHKSVILDIYWEEHRKNDERKYVRLFRKANVTDY